MNKLVCIKYLFCAVLLFVGVLTTTAQRLFHVTTHSQNTSWDAPYLTTDIDSVRISQSNQTMTCYMSNGVEIPFNMADIDSLTVEENPAVESKDHYKVFQLFINTVDGEGVTSRDEYKTCYVSLNALDSYENRSASAQIRGRGNSSWLWYDKKPMRLKFDEKHKVLGLSKAKSWVLLPNYRDVTDLMNTFVFECAKWLDMPFSNNTRYVELFLDGEYRGLYQLTEQVQQGSNRVDIDSENGILLSLDVDDGPDEKPAETDNFWSSVYSMPVCVKYPEDVTSQRKSEIKEELAILENAIKNKDYALADSLMDMKSFMHYLMLQELVENVELVAPRSIFLFKDAPGNANGDSGSLCILPVDKSTGEGGGRGPKWTFGPMWDFDAGYDFDWSNMYTGHTYFSDYTELVMGTKPESRNGYDHSIPAFFTNLFGCKEFVDAYKAEWNNIKDSIVTRNWAECEKYLAYMRKGPVTREFSKWPISGKKFEDEVTKLKTWLTNRVQYLGWVISAYPEPSAPTTSDQFCGTMDVTTSMKRRYGYSQTNKVVVSQATLANLLGVSNFDTNNIREIVPLDTEGNEGDNNTNGTYGAWFDYYGDPGYWGEGHVYIEIYEDLLNWNCGLHPDNCVSDSSHTVTMQIRYADGTTLKKVNVKVKFSIK